MKGSAPESVKRNLISFGVRKENKEGTLGFFFYVFMAKRWVDQIVRQNIPFWMQCLLSECVCVGRFVSNQIESNPISATDPEPRTPSPVPLLPYFLTSFMGCHVSNGNENLCVCNWRRGAGSRSSVSVPGRVFQHPRFLSDHFARLEPRSPIPETLSTLNLKPQTTYRDPRANVMLVPGLLLAFT